MRVLVSGFLFLVLASACGETRSTPAAAPTPTHEKIVVELEPMTLPKVLPSEACFVAVHSYDVMLLGVRLRDAYSCARVAAEVFPDTEQLPWLRDEYRDSDQVEECELERGGGWLQIMRGDSDQQGPRFDAAYDLSERACRRLAEDGWGVIFQEK